MPDSQSLNQLLWPLSFFSQTKERWQFLQRQRRLPSLVLPHKTTPLLEQFGQLFFHKIPSIIF